MPSSIQTAHSQLSALVGLYSTLEQQKTPPGTCFRQVQVSAFGSEEDDAYDLMALSMVALSPDGRESRRMRFPREKRIISPFHGWLGQITDRL